MLRITASLLLALSILGVPALVGCDREVAHERKVDVKDDGTVKKSETTVTEKADGTIEKKETKSVDRP